MLSEVWRILYVVGMVLGIGFCAACVLMCVLIGVMVIRACVTYDDDILDTQPRQVSKEKADREAQVNLESEKNWSDMKEKEEKEELVWLVRTSDGTWVKTESQKMYIKVGESEESEI